MNTMITEELKKVTKPIHDKLDESEFFAVLKEGKLPIESYINYLQVMAGIHAAFEKEVCDSNHPELQSVWKDSMSKLPPLLVDLESLHATEIEDIPKAIDAMLDTIKFIRLCSAENPLYLLGVMYVLEGSTLGGAILKELVLKNFNFQYDSGVLFLGHYKKQKLQNWEEFKARVNSLNLNQIEHSAILETAIDFFHKIQSIFQHLYPISKTIPFYNVTTLNPEAGRHKIPDDKLEIQAAIKAGARTWEQFPYYAWRYGLRGKQFTRSDSAWLVTLCDLDEKLIVDQIHWLGRILASRGMPQVLLSTHLENLVEELNNVHSDKKDRYHKLLTASNKLNATLNHSIEKSIREKIILEFEISIGEEWNHRLKNMGEIIVSAIVDEKLGIKNALSSVETWATDENRFPQIWIHSVRQLIFAAKKVLMSSNVNL
ncbi:MAG: biliverdin-producing heme oxygenase [Leptospiraceae bacterium]|nr:biliverdin-producing heme oxygenase [Leptospiraceae bacterium]